MTADPPSRTVDPASQQKSKTDRYVLFGTIITALAGIVVALIQQNKPAPPSTPVPLSQTVSPIVNTGAEPSPTFSLAPTSSPTPTPTTPASADGVTYQCTGTAPDGILITYGSTSKEATNLPFTFHEDGVDNRADSYSMVAHLYGSGQVTCTLTLTWRGRTTIASDTATGGFNEAVPDICPYGDGWQVCHGTAVQSSK